MRKMRAVCPHTRMPSRYEPHYVPGGTYRSPACGVLHIVLNCGCERYVTDLSEPDMDRLVEALGPDFRHAAA